MGTINRQVVDLDIAIDRAAAVSLPHQIGRAILDMIRAGTLPRGTRLPASRTLAARLGVARLTVVEAYAWLADQDYIASRRGARCVVQDVPLATASSPLPAHPAEHPDPLPAPAIDFRAGCPDLAHFPRRQWASALAAAAKELPDEALGYGDPLGHPPLRRAISGYLLRSRGLAVDPARIAITMGSAQSVDLILRALPEYREIIVEHPGHLNLKRLAAIHPVSFRGIAVDREGLRTDLLPGGAAPRIVIVTPSHQFPTGYRMSLPRRSELIAWAMRTGAMIIEDDYDSEFAYGGRLPLPLAKLDQADRVAYIGSFSKTLFPALRLGFMIVPAPLAETIAALKHWADLGGAIVQQDALARWIETGMFERHIHRMRGAYQRRHRQMAALLSARLGDRVRILDAPVSMHLLAFFRTGLAREEVAARAAARGVRLYPLEAGSGLERPGERGAILGFGNLDETAIDHGIAVLAEVLDAGG